jgi:hypothetical protein
MSRFLQPPHKCIDKILRDAADIANSERAGVLPARARAAGAPFREANSLSSDEYLTLTYDPGILTGLPPEEVFQIDQQMRQVAQTAVQVSLVQNQDLFVSLIMAGIKDGTSYIGGL